MREDKEAGEAHGIGGVAEEETSAEAEIGVGGGNGEVGVEKARELGSGNGVVEDVFTDNDIGSLQPERDGVHVE